MKNRFVEVVLTHRARQDATCGGLGMDSEVLATPLWVRHGDHWLAADYHESPIGD